MELSSATKLVWCLYVFFFSRVARVEQTETPQMMNNRASKLVQLLYELQFVQEVKSFPNAKNRALIRILFLEKGEKVVRREVCAITSRGTLKKGIIF